MSTKKLDGYTPTNAMIACCNGTGDYIKRADYEKLEKENEQLRLEADRQTEIADAMTVYAGNDASTIKEIVAIKNENEQLRKDKGLLDWLENVRKGLIEAPEEYPEGLALRQAIDAEMNQKGV